MQSAVFRVGSGFSVETMPEPPDPVEGQMLVETIATGICGSDLSIVQHTYDFLRDARDAGAASYIFDPTEPLVLGHEFCGRVVKVGPNVLNLSVGDVVVALSRLTDGNGVNHAVGISTAYPGAFAERFLVSGSNAHRVPPGLDPAVASLTEPLSLGFQTVHHARMTGADTAIVFGAGAIGLGTIAALRVSGISHIIAVEPSENRRQMALRFGAHLALHPDEGDPIREWRARTSGQGKVVAFECTGKTGMLNHLILLLPPGSRIMVEGMCAGEDAIRPSVAKLKGIALEFEAVIEAPDSPPPTRNDFMRLTLGHIASGLVEASALITYQVGLHEVAKVFEQLANSTEHIKILVRPAIS